MLSGFIDFLNVTSLAQAAVRRAYPGETILYSTAATFLETAAGNASPSPGARFFKQVRGNIVMTDRRMVFQGGTISLMTLVWMAVAALYFYRAMHGGTWVHVLIGILGVLMLIQRRPFRREITLDEVRRVETGAVQGVFGKGETMAVKTPERVIQFVTTKPVSEELSRRWNAVRRI